MKIKKYSRIKRTSSENTRIKNLLGTECAHCGDTKSLTIDHIIPICYGGLDAITNFQLLCEYCNTLKGSLIPDTPVAVVRTTELYQYYIKNTINGSDRYKMNVFVNCFGKRTLNELFNTFVTLDQLDKLKEFSHVYKVIPIRMNIEHLVRYIPSTKEQNNELVKYDPIFAMSFGMIFHQFLEIPA